MRGFTIVGIPGSDEGTPSLTRARSAARLRGSGVRIRRYFSKATLNRVSSIAA